MNYQKLRSANWLYDHVYLNDYEATFGSKSRLNIANKSSYTNAAVIDHANYRIFC
ncbi:hypothetical protein IGK47_004439 [Enterococcus sp. AZ007]